ncbi:MAG TPA: hypothetical protein VIU12_24150 [Chryseolinea sp.]
MVYFLLFPPWQVHFRDVDLVYPLGSHWFSSKDEDLHGFLPPETKAWLLYNLKIDNVQQAVRIVITGLIAAVLYPAVQSKTKTL